MSSILRQNRSFQELAFLPPRELANILMSARFRGFDLIRYNLQYYEKVMEPTQSKASASPI